MNMRVARSSATPVRDPTSSNTKDVRATWDVKGSGAEHKSEKRDAETQNICDEGQTATGSAASSLVMRQCCHHERVVDEMAFVLPRFLNLALFFTSKRQHLSHLTWWTEVIVKRLVLIYGLSQHGAVIKPVEH